MGISSEQSDRQRLQGLVPASDISTYPIGNLAFPTEHRTRLQNDDRHQRGHSAERHLGECSRFASTLRAGQYAARSRPA